MPGTPARGPARGPGRRAAAALGVALAGAALLGACGDGGGAPDAGGSPCGPDRSEPLDPGSAGHLLPGAAEPRYAADPPTSGPHLPGPALAGVQPGPLARPVQVGLLEDGGVLIQHRGLSGDDRARLASLADADVVVAPNPDLDVPVVATAWRHRMRCPGADDLGALRTFIAAHRGRGAG